MATCKKCIHYDACKAILDAVGIEMDEECPNQEYLCGNFMDLNLSQNTMTNADRIRSMSDEELAQFLCGVYDEDEDAAKFINGVYIPCYDQHGIKEWLKQPEE